jgi:hypothetical protein
VRALKEELTLVIDQLLKDQYGHRAALGDEPRSRYQPVCGAQRRMKDAANDVSWRPKKSASGAKPDLLSCYLVCAKKLAKLLDFLLLFGNFAMPVKRRRAALAACFIGFFSLFPSDSSCAKLSTTP